MENDAPQRDTENGEERPKSSLATTLIALLLIAGGLAGMYAFHSQVSLSNTDLNDPANTVTVGPLDGGVEGPMAVQTPGEVVGEQQDKELIGDDQVREPT